MRFYLATVSLKLNSLFFTILPLLSYTFSIFSVGNQDKFSDGNIPKVKEQTTKLIVRANIHGEPKKDGNKISVGDKYYTLI